MSQTPIALEQSLLGEEDFMAELGNECRLTSSRPRGQAANSRPGALDFHAGPRKPGMFIEDDDPVADPASDVAPARPTVMWRLTAAAMFVFMMGVGAAGAVAVFHERVARIVASWQ